MRPLALALAAAALTLSTPALAASPVRSSGNLGLGVGGGFGVSGLSGKYFVNDDNAFQLIVGGDLIDPDFGRGQAFAVGLDYLYEMPTIAKADPLDLAFNLGVGGTVALWDDGIGVFASGVIGLEFNFDLDVLGLDLVLEYRPGVYITPEFGPDFLNFSGHFRVYPFK